MTIDEYLKYLANLKAILNTTTTIATTPLATTPIATTIKEAHSESLIPLKVFFYFMGAAAFSAIFFLIVF